MATYEGWTRTNYFEVKNLEDFEKWAQKYELKVIRDESRVGLLPAEDCNDFPYGDYYDEETDTTIEDIDFDAELRQHLKEGEIVVIQHVGHEKCRYFNGSAYAFDSTGKSVSVCLDDIYEKVKALWGEGKATACQY